MSLMGRSLGRGDGKKPCGTGLCGRVDIDNGDAAVGDMRGCERVGDTAGMYEVRY